MGITLASFMALGTMPCSNDMLIIMESGTLHGSHSCFKRIMLISSSPVLFLALHAFNIVIISDMYNKVQVHPTTRSSINRCRWAVRLDRLITNRTDADDIRHKPGTPGPGVQGPNRVHPDQPGVAKGP